MTLPDGLRSTAGRHVMPVRAALALILVLVPIRAGAARAAPHGACAALERVVAAAPGGFAAVRGIPDERRDGISHATVAVVGGTDCLVYGGSPAAYGCDLYAGDQQALADDAYNGAVERLRRCLPHWRKTSHADGVHTVTRLVAPRGGIAVRVISGLQRADAYLVDLWVDAPVHRPRR
jgi:hypothetical protein